MPPSKLKEYSALFLTQKGDVELGTIKGDASGLTLEAIQASFKKRQTIEPIGTYQHKTLTLFLFGSTTGKDGQENQHQLPPPYDMTPFFMNIILIASKDENSFSNTVPFQIDEYEAFYTKSFGGFTSDDSDDELSQPEVDELPIEDTKDFPNDEDVEEDSEDDEEEEENIIEDVAEAEPVIQKVKAVKKKKVAAKAASNNLLTGSLTAYPDRPILSEDKQLQEETIPVEQVQPTISQRKKVYSALEDMFKGLLDPMAILQLEASIYNGSIKRSRKQNIVRSWNSELFVHMYNMHAIHIAGNFNPNSYVGNKELFDRYKNKEITFDDISKMDLYELFPSRWKEQFESQQIREKRQLEGNRSMATDIFLCTKCWKRECTYYEMQTRSADEPMTIFITCLNCGKHWRQ
jgi:DNA-directed RNA polymerase subunit M/transcription elongation factor TFIIS